MRLFESLVARVNDSVRILVVLAYAALIVNVSAAVFFRYVMNSSLVWAEELARYLFVWITFLAAGLGAGKNIHIGMDYFLGKLRDPAQRWAQIAINSGVIVFLCVLIVVGLQLAEFGTRSPSMLLGVRMSYVYAAVPVGALVMLLNVALVTLRLLAETSPGGRR